MIIKFNSKNIKLGYSLIREVDYDFETWLQNDAKIKDGFPPKMCLIWVTIYSYSVYIVCVRERERELFINDLLYSSSVVYNFKPTIYFILSSSSC